VRKKTDTVKSSSQSTPNAVDVGEAGTAMTLEIAEETEANEDLVNQAFERLKDMFHKHFHEAMLEAGNYIIQTFYGNNPQNVLSNQPVQGKSLNRLVKELQQGTGDVPSRGWFYNAVNLAAHEKIFNLRGVQTFGQLKHSHKLLLLHVPDWEEKKRLAKEAVEADPPYTVRQLRDRIKEEFVSEKRQKTFPLLERHAKQLTNLLNEARIKIQPDGPLAGAYEKVLKQVESLLGPKEKSTETKKGGFRDWTEPEDNVNFCTGCENNCIYCYAKLRAQRFRQLKGNKWNEMKMRQHDIDKNRKLHNGLVGFPSTHDIFPSNIDAYLTVLGRLLRAGNGVLIVSKPRLDCIKRICEAGQFFKDKILFRFTIGAMDDKILTFWEPNAPCYEERKTCLEYAFQQGFRTSVSMEPMLDTVNIESVVADLEPFVNKDIWLGTMNHLGRIRKGADKRLLKEIDNVEAGQIQEILTAIYNTYLDNPKIKWKTEALKRITN
jgi:DNA repair photolyase